MPNSITSASNANVPVLRGWNPLRNLQSGVNRVFDDFFGDFNMPALWGRPDAFNVAEPAIDIVQNDKAYTINAEIPGLNAKDVKVTVADGYLVLAGEKSEEKTTERADYVCQERSYGSFQRVVGLPADADLDSASAQMRNGVLSISVKRRVGAAANERRLDIREVA
ncbi:MAG TPA: Hsp20/alpha crystallin family protein [Asticcacaulis sp.]|jgi:HSP20 family protein|nr:Hsp20/alpha crystallin family protein [Asticcacaulis sp.]